MSRPNSFYNSISETLTLLLNTPLVDPDPSERAPTAFQLRPMPAQPSSTESHPGPFHAAAVLNPRTQPDRLAEEGMALCIPTAAQPDRKPSLLGPRDIIIPDENNRADTEADLVVVQSSAISSTASASSSVSTRTSASLSGGP